MSRRSEGPEGGGSRKVDTLNTARHPYPDVTFRRGHFQVTVSFALKWESDFGVHTRLSDRDFTPQESHSKRARHSKC